MKNIKYFFQFLLAITCFAFFKLLGPTYSSNLSGKLFEKIGPFFRPKKIIYSNIRKAIPNISEEEINNFTKSMWNNYGRVFAEYMFIKDFRLGKLESKVEINGQEILEEIKKLNKQVIFISGHFSNFELMAMYLEKSGIDLAAIYRPLNNIFLNPIMEKIRKNYICKKQVKKGISGTKEILRYFKNGTSIALMIDQRVSEGINCKFFDNKALTTTIPAQFVKKFNCKVTPIYIQRLKADNFKLEILKPIEFSKDETIESITLNLNKVLENLIRKNPEQWIWSHNRWK